MFEYYMRSRWPSPGAIPKVGYIPEETIEYSDRRYVAEVGRNVFAKICYSRPLSIEEIKEYELIPAEGTEGR